MTNLLGFSCSECSTAVTCDAVALSTFTCPTCHETAAPTCAMCANHFAPVATESMCEECGAIAVRLAKRERQLAEAELI